MGRDSCDDASVLLWWVPEHMCLKLVKIKSHIRVQVKLGKSE